MVKNKQLSKYNNKYAIWIYLGKELYDRLFLVQQLTGESIGHIFNSIVKESCPMMNQLLDDLIISLTKEVNEDE